MEGLSPEQRQIVQHIFREYLPKREVWMFGSRANGQARSVSDLDVAILGDQPLSLQVMGDLREAFEESDLPFRVDLVDWAITSDEFRQIIQKQHQVLQEV